MGTVLKLIQFDHGSSKPNRPCSALSDVLPKLARLVSQVETLKISSIEEWRQAFSVLGTCIRSIVTRHIPVATPRRRELLIQCDKIDQLITSARMQNSRLNEC